MRKKCIMEAIYFYSKKLSKKYDHEKVYSEWRKANPCMLGMPGPGFTISPETLPYMLLSLLKSKDISIIFFLKTYSVSLLEMYRFRLKRKIKITSL